MAREIEFHDKALDQLIRSSATQFKSFQKVLDETSADVRSLEKWLQECGVCITCYVKLPPGRLAKELGWDKYGDSWRIVCEFIGDDGPQIRPLIETSARMRLSCKGSLLVLVKALQQLLPKNLEEQEGACYSTNSIDRSEESDMYSAYELLSNAGEE